VLEYRLCRACGIVKPGETSERPVLWRNACRCGGNWRILSAEEAAELFRLPPYELNIGDVLLLIALGIDPEVPECS
jgi:hypothetical protein